ncbi:MAG: hypothetical protein K2J15_04690, partial [Muribaculaceae bacterium]|nr:hypothetical protein [Muribaculaceae bacterium]
KIVYFRSAPCDKLKRKKIKNSEGIEYDSAYCELPLDDLDEMILAGIKQLDASVDITSHLIWTDDEEPRYRKIVSALPEAEVEIISTPDFSGLSQAELMNLDGMKFSRYGFPIKVHTYGRLNHPVYIDHNYPYNGEDEAREIFKRLREEIEF